MVQMIKNSLLWVTDLAKQSIRLPLLAACLLCGSQLAWAAAHFKPINGAEQLPTSSINHIIQRQDGFIWMATVEGVSRYDGKNFVNHTADMDLPHSLPNSWANYLLEDHQQQLWVATAGGLARLNADGYRFTNYLPSPSNPNSLAGKNIVHLFEDQQNRLWVASDLGLSLYRPATDDFLNHYISGQSQNTDTNQINVVGQKDANTLWIGNKNGLFVFDVTSSQFTAFPMKHANANQWGVLDLVTDHNRDVWVATAKNGLYKINAITNEITTFQHDPNKPNSLTSNELWSLMVDLDNHIWVTSWGEGISQVKPDGQVIRHRHTNGDVHSIPSDMTSAVYQDHDGLVWVATHNGAAIHQPDNPFEIIRPIPGDPQSLSNEMVWSFVETEDAIWISTSQGINRWDKQSDEITSFLHDKARDKSDQSITVWIMAPKQNHELWLGTDQGLGVFNTQDHRLSFPHEAIADEQSQLKKLLKNPVWILGERDDDSVWVGTNHNGLYAMDTQLQVIENHSDLIKNELAQQQNIEFTQITQDQNNNLWLGTSSGLYFLERELKRVQSAHSITGEPLFNDDWIMSMEQHWENLYWISSQHAGLNLYQLNPNGTAKKLLQFDQNHPNITDRSAYIILVKNDHEVWFTGKSNLYHLNYDDKTVTNYGSSYFDPNITFHENSQYKGTDGLIYMGSNRGAIRFNPQKIHTNNQPLRLYFTGIFSDHSYQDSRFNASEPNLFGDQKSIQALASPTHLLDSVSYAHQDSVFSFQFAALDYLNAEHLQYAYRIPQLNKHWVNLRTNNELTLTNLPAGHHQLQVKVFSTGFHFGENLATIELIVPPKPWFSWWAKLMYALVALSIAWIIFRLYRTRLLTQYALQHRETQLSQAIWGSGDELWEWNIKKQEITRMNSAELNVQKQRVFTGSFKDTPLRIHEEDWDNLQNKINAILECQTDEFDAIYRQQNQQGEWVWIQDRAKVTAKNEAGLPLIVNGISRNISSIKANEERSLLITSAFQSSSDGAIVLDADFKIISINAAFTAITGFDERLINKYMPWRGGPLSTPDMPSGELFEMISKVVLKGGSYSGEVTLNTIDGRQIPVDLRVNCIYNEKNIPSHYIATLTDITYRKHTEEELKQLANYDGLTGLPNRTLMMVELNRFLHKAKHHNTSMAVMFVDLDHFKNINDSLGHSIGDELLVAAGKRLEHCVRKSDMVARIGGDEFTIGIIDYDSVSDVIKVAEKVLKTMSRPFQLTDHELIITPSIGIATYNNDHTDVETLLMQADTAMYHAKQSGRNNFQFFTDSMNEAVLNRVDLEMRLRKALKNKELSLDFQPKFNINTGRLSGFEALIRWRSEGDQLIPPDDFIPIAEETGLITTIGQFVLDQACQQLSQWHQQGHTDIHIAINLSAVQFMDKNLVNLISKKLQKHNLNPNALELEITESTLIDNFQYTIKTLNELRSLGVKLSLDDFGTGFSSLNYLKQFPIHALKIDRTFIQDIETDQHDASMVQSIVTLAHNLSIEVVAEGVETLGQLDLLKSYQIEEIQGFLLSKPFDAPGATDFLTSGHTINTLIDDRNITPLNAGSAN